MEDRLTEEEVSDRAEVPLEEVRRLVALGILDASEDGFQRRDVMRVRVVAALEAKGVDRDDLATALASGHLTLGYLESAGRRHPRSDETFSQLAERLGLDIEALERIFVAFGLP
ncbi:MAG TPA: hypothetical protein VIX39_07685, partial [Actinomycetota bacterium]